MPYPHPGNPRLVVRLKWTQHDQGDPYSLLRSRTLVLSGVLRYDPQQSPLNFLGLTRGHRAREPVPAPTRQGRGGKRACAHIDDAAYSTVPYVSSEHYSKTHAPARATYYDQVIRSLLSKLISISSSYKVLRCFSVSQSSLTGSLPSNKLSRKSHPSLPASAFGRKFP